MSTQSEFGNGVDKADSERLEHLIDHYGLDCVLHEISSICGAKAEHLAHAWQDVNSAKLWDRAASQINRAIAKVGEL